MKINLALTLVKTPEQFLPLIQAVGVQEVVFEDVSSFEFNENEIILHFNKEEDQKFPLRSNDGTEPIDWRGVNMQIIRKFMEVDLSK